MQNSPPNGGTISEDVHLSHPYAMKSLDPLKATLHSRKMVMAVAADRLDIVWMSLATLSVFIF